MTLKRIETLKSKLTNSVNDQLKEEIEKQIEELEFMVRKQNPALLRPSLTDLEPIINFEVLGGVIEECQKSTEGDFRVFKFIKAN